MSIAESSRVFTESTALVLKPHPYLPSAIKVSKPIVAARDLEGCSELCFHGACRKLGGIYPTGVDHPQNTGRSVQ